MKRRCFIPVLSFLALSFSCELADTDTVLLPVEGIISDHISGEPVAGLTLNIDAIKSPSGMGIITDGSRVTAAQTTTDSKGYYKAKLKIFEGAETLEFILNSGHEKAGYVETKHTFDFPDLNGSGNKIDFTMSPTALLLLKIKNTQPASDSDYFGLGWHDRITEWSRGWTRGILEKENCGTVTENGLIWIGKDVCANYVVEAIAGDYIFIYWTVKKDGVTNEYKDSTYVERGIMNEYILNY